MTHVVKLIAALFLIQSLNVYAMCGGMFAPDVKPQPVRLGQQMNSISKPTITNKATRVALVRDQDATIITMSNDVQTDADEFALVVPVPTKIERSAVRVVDDSLFTTLQKNTSPQLVESYDPDPCPVEKLARDKISIQSVESVAPSAKSTSAPRAAKYGVKVEAHYSVGEYSIAILSAKKGSGLVEWLNKFHYNIPQGAIEILNSYIKQDMKFFVAKVDFHKQKDSGFKYLRPLQVKYNTPKFILPIRLGMINATEPQELEVYALSPQGRIESTNYQTISLPTGAVLPLYMKDRFADFIHAVFDAKTAENNMRAIFLEFAGDAMSSGLTEADLRKFGIPWSEREKLSDFGRSYVLSKLHFRYTRDGFPEDLVFQETGNRTPFAMSFTVQHLAKNLNCEEGQAYLRGIPTRRKQEAQTLASLTGWDLADINEKMGNLPEPQPVAPPVPPPKEKAWWQKIWGS